MSENQPQKGQRKKKDNAAERFGEAVDSTARPSSGRQQRQSRAKPTASSEADGSPVAHSGSEMKQRQRAQKKPAQTQKEDPRIAAQRERLQHLGLTEGSADSSPVLLKDYARALRDMIPTLSEEQAQETLLKFDMDFDRAVDAVLKQGGAEATVGTTWSAVVSRRHKLEQKKQQQEADRAARITCHVCGEAGHRQRDCPKKSKYLPRGGSAHQQRDAQQPDRGQPTKQQPQQQKQQQRRAAKTQDSAPPFGQREDNAQPPAAERENDSTALDSDSTATTCPVCRELYVDPRILDCLHSVCARCVRQLVMPQTPTFLTCAVCASPTEMPPDGLGGLPQNHALATAVDGERAARRFCENCEKATSSVFCYDCKAFMCTPCSENIHSQRIARGHNVVGAAEKKTVARTCREHEGERLSLFCVQCNQVVCSLCLLVGSHHGHKCAALKDMSLDTHDHLTAKIRTTEQHQHQLINVYDSIDTAMHNIEGSFQDVCGRVRSHFGELHSLLEQRMNFLLASAARVRDMKNTALLAKQEELRLYIRQVKEGWECAEKLLELCDDVELMAMKRAIERRLDIVQSLNVQLQPGAGDGIGVRLDTSVATAINKYGTVGGMELEAMYQQPFSASNGHDVAFGSSPQAEQWSH